PRVPDRPRDEQAGEHWNGCHQRNPSPAQRRERGYHSMDFRSLKNPPVGPSGGSVASHTIVSAPSSTDFGAPRPPMSVRTQPGLALLTSTPVPFVAPASCRVNAFSALFDIEYAGAYVPIDDSCPASDDTFTTRPYF